MTTYSKIVISICAFIVLSIFVYAMLYKGSIIVAVNSSNTTTPAIATTTAPIKATSTPIKPSGREEQEMTQTTRALGESALIAGIEITPIKIIEDSRCPIGVQCIQAGRVRADVKIKIGSTESTYTMLVGEPLVTESGIVTLLSVTPVRVSGVEIKEADYRLSFKATREKITYKNASTDLITITTPLPGSVTGRNFKIIGSARGQWFFEATSKVTLLDKSGNTLAQSIGKPDDDALTENFVPFSAEVTVPETYSGVATIVLANDNPSGLPENDKSISFPITIAE